MNRLRNAGVGLAVGVGICLLAAVIVPVSTAAPSRRTCLGAKATIVGTKGDDHLTATSHADVIVGLGGDDDISGLGGDDKICGGSGIDRIDGGRGSDRESGGRGSDNFSPPGDPGRDLFDGGRGVDVLFFNNARAGVKVNLSEGFARAGAGRDEIAVGTVEWVYGSPSRDWLFGDSLSNVLFAGFDSVGDVIAGTATGLTDESLTEIENVEGTAANDSITGNAGPNLLYGGPRADSISAGASDDMVYGDGVAPMPTVLTDYFGDGSPAGPDGGDSLDGGPGVDLIDGGGATDTCSSGEQVSNCEG